MNWAAMHRKIVELCSEDTFGSWELWWGIRFEFSGDSIDAVREQFLNGIVELVEKGDLLPRHKKNGKFCSVTFGRERLKYEIDNADDPDPESFFWFDIS